MGSLPDRVVVAVTPPTVGDVVAVAAGAGVEIAPEAMERIRASRAVLEQVLASGQPVYGVTSGVGHERDTPVQAGSPMASESMLLFIHAAAIGPPLPPPWVRATMFARIAGMAVGGAGVSPGVVETLVAMLDRGVHPVVPSAGSVGAGDLGQLAAVGLVAIGVGRAELDGEEMDAAEALRRAGIDPAELGPKDGLALMSANSVSVGAGALAIDHADATLRLADLAAAASMEAYTANPELANAIAASAKPVPGQVETASRLRRLLAGTELGGDAVSLQDPLSFRVVPQVHGAVRAILESVRTAVETELGGRNDNPLVAVEERVVVQSANFHPMLMALGFDALRPGLIHVGAISERRMSHLWERVFAGGTPDAGMLASISGGPGLWYAAAARFSELRPLAAPASLAVPPLDLNHEDHATAAPATVAATHRALNLLDDILVCELIFARDVIVAAGDRRVDALGSGVRAAIGQIESVLRTILRPWSPAAVHAAVSAASSDIVAVADSAG